MFFDSAAGSTSTTVTVPVELSDLERRVFEVILRGIAGAIAGFFSLLHVLQLIRNVYAVV
jgi:hypothetical protein